MAKKKKNSGWIKLYRQIQKNPIWLSSEPFSRRDAWIDLLLLANHEERVIIVNGKAKDIGAGQHWTSYRILAERWHWSNGKVKRFFELLSELDMVHVNGTPNGTLVTLVNYSFFQDERNTKRNADGTTDGLTDGISDGRQTRINKELNTRMNNKNRAAPVFDSGGYEIEE